MSTVDNKVVQMTFDNKKFEANAKTTMNTIKELNKSLDFSNTTKDLKKFQNEIDKFNVNALNTAAEKIANSFTLTGRAINKALSDIAAKAVQTGEQVVKALTISPVMDGFREYENKIQSIQVIAANTGVLMRNLDEQTSDSVWKTYNWSKDEIKQATKIIEEGKYGNGQERIDSLTESGYTYNRVQAKVNDLLYQFSNEGEDASLTIEDIEAGLDNLNEYADDTIYNFAQMTSAIGQFTTAGVDFNTSVASVKGIANLAALVGAPASDASRAMFQLSQGLATGYISLQDWLSIEHTAGMSGKIFQDTIMQTARKHGVAIDEMIEEDGKFRLTLQRGWLTSDILNESLAKISGDYDSDYWQMLGYTEDEINEIIKLGEVAKDAATKVRTWTQLWDSLKEAAGSGWAKSWEIIIGDFYEAPILLTRINDAVSGVLDNMSDFRNRALEMWKSLHGRDALIEGLANTFKAIGNVIHYVTDAFQMVFDVRPSMLGIYLSDISKSFYKFSTKLVTFTEKMQWLTNVFAAFFYIAKVGLKIIGGALKLIFAFLNALFSGIGGIIPALETLSEWLLAGASAILEFTQSEKIFVKMKAGVVKAAEGIKWIFEKLGEVLGFVVIKIGEGIGKLSNMSFKEALVEIGTFFATIPILAIEFLRDLSLDKALEAIISFPVKVIKGIKDKSKDMYAAIKEALGSKKNDKDNQEKLEEKTDDMDKTNTLLETIVGKLSEFWYKIKQAFSQGNVLYNFLMSLTTLSTVSMFHSIKNFFDSFDLSAISDVIKATAKVVKNTAYTMKAFGDVLKAYSLDIKAGALIKVALAVILLTVAITALTKIPTEKIVYGAGVIAALLGVIMLVTTFAADFGRFMAFSLGMVALAAALNLLLIPILIFSFIPVDKLYQGITIFVTIMAVLVIFTKILAKSVGVLNYSNTVFGETMHKKSALLEMAAGLLAIALAINMLVVPLLIFSFMPYEKMQQGVNTLITILAILVAVMGIIHFMCKKPISNKNVIVLGFTASLLAFVSQILIPEILIFSFMNKEKLDKGMQTVGKIFTLIALIMAGVVTAMKLMKGISYKQIGALAIVIFTAGHMVGQIADALMLVALIPDDKLSQAWLTILEVVGICAAFVAIIAFIEKYVGTSAGPGFKLAGTLIAIALGLYALMGVITVFALMEPSRLWSGVAAIMAICSGLTLVLIALGYMYRYQAKFATARGGSSAANPFDWKKMAVLATVILSCATSYWILSQSMFKLCDAFIMLTESSHPVLALIGVLSATILPIAGIILGLLLIPKALDKIKAKKLREITYVFLGFTAVLLGLAVAVAVLAASAQGLNQLNVGAIVTIISSLLILMAALTVMVGFVSKSGAGAAKGLWALAGVLGTFALIAVGVGLLAFAISSLIKALIMLDQADLSHISEKMTMFLEAVSYNCGLIKQIINELFEIIYNMIARFMTRGIEFTCTLIIAAAKPICDAILEAIRVLNTVAKDLANEVVILLINILEGVDEHIEELIAAILVLIIDTLYALADTIRANKHAIWDSIWQVIEAIGEVVWDALLSIAEWIMEGLSSIFGGIFDDILDSIKVFRGKATKAVYGSAEEYYVALYGGKIKDIDKNDEVWKQVEKDFNALADENGQIVEETKTKKAIKTHAKAVNPYAQGNDTGKNFTNGLSDGVSGATDVVKNLTSKLKSNFDEGKEGMFNVKGIGAKLKDALGIELDFGLSDITSKFTSGFDLSSMTEGLGFNVSNMGANFGDISQVMTADSFNLNTDQLNLGAEDVNMSTDLNDSSVYTRNLSSNINANTNDGTTKITDSIASLGNKISDLVEPMKQLKVYLDTGVLVGEIAEPMDEALGSRAASRSRGV